MVTEEQVRQALHTVMDPEIGRPIDDLGMVDGVRMDGDTVHVDVLLTIAGCPLQDRITGDVERALAPLGVAQVEVRMTPMSEEQRAALVEKLRGPGAAAAQMQQRTFFTDGATSVIAVA